MFWCYLDPPGSTEFGWIRIWDLNGSGSGLGDMSGSGSGLGDMSGSGSTALILGVIVETKIQKKDALIFPIQISVTRDFSLFLEFWEIFNVKMTYTLSS